MASPRLNTRAFSLKRPALLFALFSFAILIALSSVSINQIQHDWRQEQHTTLTLIAKQQAEIISQQINHSLSATYLLSKQIEHDQGEVIDFAQQASYLFRHIKGIDSLQLAPNGIIEHIYPLKGNEKAIGHNILQQDQRKEEAQHAIQQQKLTLAGPFRLVQGYYAVIGRKPIFIETQGRSSFWGFASVVIPIKQLLNSDNLKILENHHIQFRLTTQRHLGEPVTQILGNTELQGDIFATTELFIADNQWRLELAQQYPSQHLIAIKLWAIAIILSILLSFLIFNLASYPLRLAQKVEKQTKKLSRLAYFDNLTGLKNRTLLQLELADTLQLLSQQNEIEQSHHIAALVYLGVDDFKRLNDAFGNKIGDELLLEVTRRLHDVCSKKDIITRAGGDEFAIILPPQSSLKSIEIWLQALLKTLGQPISIDGHQLQFSISAGVALLPQDGNSAEVLIQHANLAMTHAKQKGKRRFMFYNNSMEALVKSNLSVELELNKALKNGELVLFYQPIVDLTTSKPIGFEALIRWQHPEKGLIFPDAFIPVAEQSNLITEIGYWVLEAACKALPNFPPHIHISINVSARQFMDPQLATRMKQIIYQYHATPNRITLEITETLLIENIEQVVSSLKNLRDFGLGISVDDFGTGHSSLSKLKVMPISTLKVDRAFIMDLPDNKEDKELTEAILVMAQKLQLKVVAEGVETAEQRDFLVANQCNFGQGYYFSKPVPLDHALAYTERILIKK
ncbi:bifunctional diguanylate cyclase/phosphodiesterase [Motilimonas cestriensis]|uniref:Bifunctional diguanylate cyclase/phosphodiesterase n=1 Tax=Motilimonas cestriensis TaxID=2742685 RepID=A0ABS8W8E4_9GAMM|nr:EAL domain-containing protein [Motilimonas cestriensis]MCE2594079.1 bifunctional diguanylate cyclase/phosphodiesterase [Motilimonas cestriensis]